MALQALGSNGVRMEDLREKGWVSLNVGDAPFANGGFATPSGKCVIDSPIHGVPDHVPNYESPVSTPELAEVFTINAIAPAIINARCLVRCSLGVD